MPKIALTDEEILDCFDVIFELRPHLEKSKFIATVREMEKDSFRLLYLKQESEVVAVAGYRLTTNLFMGKHLYVDDLISSQSQRSKGYGKQLIKWLRKLAKEQGCSFLHLDSGTHRGRAHKFYFEQGFTISSYHFCEKLSDS